MKPFNSNPTSTTPVGDYKALATLNYTEDDDEDWTGQVCQILFHPSSLVHMSRERNGHGHVQQVDLHLPLALPDRHYEPGGQLPPR